MELHVSKRDATYALIAINLLIAFLIGRLLFPSIRLQTFSLEYVMQIIPDLSLLLLVIGNLALAVLGFKKRITVKIHLLLTLYTVLVFGLFFFGYFFVGEPWYLLVTLAAAYLCFALYRKTAIRFGILLAGGVLLFTAISFIFGFEEHYCSKKGHDADPTGSKMVIATKEDAQQLESFQAQEGAQIGVAFRTHMLCHRTFQFIPAIKDTYFK